MEKSEGGGSVKQEPVKKDPMGKAWAWDAVVTKKI